MLKTFSLVLAGLWLIAVAAPVAAQTPDDGAWKITITPYILGASMNGTTVVAGQEATVDMSVSDLFNNLQFGAMGAVAARKGNWGVAGDAIWMSLGANMKAVDGAVDVDQGAFAFYGLRRLAPAADVLFGARVNVIQANLRFNGLLAARSASMSHTWVDPIVGLQLHTPPGGSRWHAQVYTEIGGFGAGSTFTWQVFPTLGVNVSRRVGVEFGYRWLHIDYSTGADLTLFKYDVLTQGPVIGFRFVV